MIKRNLVVYVSATDVKRFNSKWPCSNLRIRPYKFEYDSRGDLIDTNLPESHDGPAASAMADDCKAWLFDDTAPEWKRIKE